MNEKEKEETNSGFQNFFVVVVVLLESNLCNIYGEENSGVICVYIVKEKWLLSAWK